MRLNIFLSEKYKKHTALISPQLLLVLSIICIIIIAVSSWFEYQARQKDYVILLNTQSTVFINTISHSINNAIMAAEKIESEINSRIITSLKIIDKFDRNNQLSKGQLDTLLQVADMEVLLVYDSRGKLILKAPSELSQKNSIPAAIIQARLKRARSDTILTLYNDQNQELERLAALIPRERGGLIAGIIGKEEILSLRKILGIGYFLKRFQAEENIKYIVIQNSETIVAGSFAGYTISSFSKDPLLREVLKDKKIQSRITQQNKQLIFETVSVFDIDGQPFGLLRLGLSMQEYEKLQKDVRSRLFVFVSVLIVFGFIFISFFITYRGRKLLHRDLELLQDYTNTVLDNLKSGVISIDFNGKIQTINKQGLYLLNLEYPKVIYQPTTVLPSGFFDVIKQCLDPNKQLPKLTKQELTDIKGRKRLINLHSSRLKDGEGNITCVLLIDDVTDQTRLEEQITRNQKLVSMRNLAFSVAHEIKNPLNAIKLIVDLIRKKYQPAGDAKTYSQNLDTVGEEINRISAIVEQYLRYARPPDLKLAPVLFPALLEETGALFKSSLQQKNIIFELNLESHPPIKGDKDQLKQVFINLIKNSEQAMAESGKISITGKNINSYYEICLRDNGKGISQKNMDFIFDFHFTTKREGNGIGLFVVQQVISAHNAKIDVESEEGGGTTVILQFPTGD